MARYGRTREARLRGKLGLAPGELAYTEAERVARHYEKYGTYELPPRGTGLTAGSKGTKTFTIVGFALLGIVTLGIIAKRR